jgi:hypothetical protein
MTIQAGSGLDFAIEKSILAILRADQKAEEST